MSSELLVVISTDGAEEACLKRAFFQEKLSMLYLQVQGKKQQWGKNYYEWMTNITKH